MQLKYQTEYKVQPKVKNNAKLMLVNLATSSLIAFSYFRPPILACYSYLQAIHTLCFLKKKTDFSLWRHYREAFNAISSST